MWSSFRISNSIKKKVKGDSHYRKLTCSLNIIVHVVLQKKNLEGSHSLSIERPFEPTTIGIGLKVGKQWLQVGVTALVMVVVAKASHSLS